MASVFSLFTVVLVLSWGFTNAMELPMSASFEDYVVAFQRSFAASEYVVRRGLFEQRAERIRIHNSGSARLWQAGFNEFTDRTAEELAMLRGWRGRGVRAVSQTSRTANLLDTHLVLPKSVDWSYLDSLKSVTDQGPCGSCWAFATASMLWAHVEIQTNETKMFSPQQLVDCTPNPQKCGGTGGCMGATVELAMGYIESIGIDKLLTLEQMPYRARDSTCVGDLVSDFDGTMRRVAPHGQAGLGVSLLGWSTLPSNEALPLMQALLDGPVAASVAADGWFSYIGGIFDGCPKDAVIDHAVLAIGFGEEDKVRYWNIRNSWGEFFGERGNIRVLRLGTPSADQDFCGIDHNPKDGVACEPYPDQVEVCGMCGILFDSVAPKFGKADKAFRKFLSR